MKITIHDDLFSRDITIDTQKRDKNICIPRGSMLCSVHPVYGIPLALEIAITPEGKIVHRGYSWTTTPFGNTYLHVDSYGCGEIIPTTAMAETIAGLFSGRIKIDGIKIAVGATPQHYCPIDMEAEEKQTGKKIYLA